MRIFIEIVLISLLWVFVFGNRKNDTITNNLLSADLRLKSNNLQCEHISTENKSGEYNQRPRSFSIASLTVISFSPAQLS